jgi:hypothetical protein
MSGLELILENARNERLRQLWDVVMGDEDLIPQSPNNAALLTLSWIPEMDDLQTAGEVDGLAKAFKDHLNYKIIERILLDDQSSAQEQATVAIHNFIRRNSMSRTLLVVYYAGHGRMDSDGNLKLTPSLRLVV